MPHLGIFLRLLLAAGLGAAIGLEREYRRKPAGLRTNILIALGSALFTVTSIQLAQVGGTPDRIAAGIVTGMGFLGGGAILRSGVSVKGMTTAATIWVNAAIGMAAGAGEYALATMATAITLVVLAALPLVEAFFERRAGRTDLNDHAPREM
jgi:putative Mg2+ transporter-C (MgtC) family protein